MKKKKPNQIVFHFLFLPKISYHIIHTNRRNKTEENCKENQRYKLKNPTKKLLDPVEVASVSQVLDFQDRKDSVSSDLHRPLIINNQPQLFRSFNSFILF